jgi:hypothetical protein
MAKIGRTLSGGQLIIPKEKKSRQGQGKNTKFSATSANPKRKKSRGQGR